MHFLLPIAAFFALTIPVVILLYLLKLKRVRTEVSSTILWRRSLEDLMANAPFQRLRRNLLLYLQILILLLLVLALTRPFLRWAGLAERNLIVLIDRSGSMQSTDVAPSRLEVAKQHALRLVEDMSRGDRMTVLAFSDHPEVIQPQTDDRMALRRAIAGITPTDARTQLSAALAIARSLAMAAKNAEVYIISDGGIPERDLALADLPQVAFIGVAERCDNLGIIDLDLREGLGQARESELFVGLRNFGDPPRRTTLRLLLDGKVIDAKEINFEPRASKSALFRNLAATEGVLELRLDATDDLAADNVVCGVLHLKKETDILLVSQGNYFLRRLLELHPDFRVTEVGPAGYSPDPPHDLVIFDDWSPAELTPGNYLMFHAAPPLTGVRATTEPLTNPVIVDWNRLHPLTRYVNFEPVSIQRALRISAPTWSQVLAESADAPMIVFFEDRRVSCLTIAFNIQDSDWPLHVSFPVFLSNTVRWLAGRSKSDTRLTYRTGETARLASRQGERNVIVETPDSRKEPLQLDEAGQALFAATDRAGLYTVRAGNEVVQRFAANLLAESESNTSPTKTLSFQGRVLKSQPERLRTNLELWFWLALAALIVLMLEWFVYCRRSSL
jgi:hypothetical protein